MKTVQPCLHSLMQEGGRVWENSNVFHWTKSNPKNSLNQSHLPNTIRDVFTLFPIFTQYL